jgi:glycosyltransferase involved in cell wall biosynthesis
MQIESTASMIGDREILVDEVQASRRSLRLAVVTETYPPEVNGVALTIYRFVEGLRLRGHDVQLIRPRQTRHDDGASHEVIMRGLPIPRYPHLKMGLPSKNALVKLWSVHRPDVVHIVTEGPLGWSALQAATKLKLPVTSDFRTNFHAYSGHYGIGWLKKPILAYLRKFHNRTACTMVPTEALRGQLQEIGFRNVRVVARGVDTRLFSPARRSEELRQQWGASPNTPVIVYVGRLASEKNIMLLAEAFEAMRRRVPEARLVLVGDGPQRRDLEARLPFAIFAGMQRNEALAEHYASGDIFLFPSVTETFGNVTPEAMASGLLTVAYDYAAASQLIVNDASGYLVPFGDGRAFVATAERLIDAWRRDVEGTRAIGAAARAVAQTLDWEELVANLESVFLSAQQAHPAFSTSASAVNPRPHWIG